MSARVLKVKVHADNECGQCKVNALTALTARNNVWNNPSGECLKVIMTADCVAPAFSSLFTRPPLTPTAKLSDVLSKDIPLDFIS